MKHSICMISDFFYPNVGGVESHIFQLSQCLLELGHKVIVITHHYEKRIGVRFMTNGLKVYYLPVAAFYNQDSFPTLLASTPIIRQVLLREKITIVHGHSAFSSLAIESIFHSKFMDMKAVLTDHSLFGFADTSSILTNKLLECAITNCDHVICVSNTSRENTSLRAKEHPSKISVIPNAVDTSMFLPDPIKAPKDRTVIVVVSRLVYRKGTDLLVGIIPKICARYPDVDFLIAGDGPKMVLIEEVKEQYKLHERVNLVGAQAQDKVRDVLVQGHIFLNTSLTEAFCMAIVEAASCGLQVVSTNVGGIPEVLPESMITLAAPSVNDLVAKLDIVIARHKDQSRMPYNEMHDKVKSFYDWRDVARRTQVVYDNVTKNPQLSFIDNVYQYKKKLSPIAYYIFALYMLMDYLIILLLDFIYPRDKIELAPDVYEFPKKAKTS